MYVVPFGAYAFYFFGANVILMIVVQFVSLCVTTLGYYTVSSCNDSCLD